MYLLPNLLASIISLSIVSVDLYLIYALKRQDLINLHKGESVSLPAIETEDIETEDIETEDKVFNERLQKIYAIMEQHSSIVPICITVGSHLLGVSDGLFAPTYLVVDRSFLVAGLINPDSTNLLDGLEFGVHHEMGHLTKKQRVIHKITTFFQYGLVFGCIRNLLTKNILWSVLYCGVFITTNYLRSLYFERDADYFAVKHATKEQLLGGINTFKWMEHLHQKYSCKKKSLWSRLLDKKNSFFVTHMSTDNRISLLDDAIKRRFL